LRKNRRYLKYAYIPLGIVLILFLAAPSLIKDPAERLVRYQTHYEKPLPYSFIIENEDLEVMQQEDFLLEIRIEGDRTPEAVFLEMAGGRYRMVRIILSCFTTVFATCSRIFHSGSLPTVFQS
jgi:hypothetical protein